jgi:tRNA A-37 threonylcarbamoyl transferase component Bud32
VRALSADPPALGEAFRPWVAGTAGGPPAVCTLRDGPDGRLVLEVTFAGSGAPERFVAKRFPDDGGAVTLGVLRALEPARAAARVLAIPQALFWDPGTRTLGLQHAPGIPYRTLAEGADAEPHLHRAGAALAELHAAAPAGLPARSLEDHLRELIRPHPEALARALPAHAVAIGRILRALRTAIARQGAVRVVAIHRDLHLGQLFADGERVWLIDWDLAAGGDAALDLGNLTAYLRTRVPAVAERCARAFADGYGPSPAHERAAAYEAMTYLRLASKRFRLREPGWEAQVADMLDRAQERLARA